MAALVLCTLDCAHTPPKTRHSLPCRIVCIITHRGHTAHALVPRMIERSPPTDATYPGVSAVCTRPADIADARQIVSASDRHPCRPRPRAHSVRQSRREETSRRRSEPTRHGIPEAPKFAPPFACISPSARSDATVQHADLYCENPASSWSRIGGGTVARDRRRGRIATRGVIPLAEHAPARLGDRVLL